MYLRRKIDAFLEEWKASNDRKPLIIKGPRQVGKTESILHFARSHYPHILYINFVEEPKFKQILSDGYSEENILRNISILSPEAALIPHETLLVFDEIQEFPDIATSLKFFKLKGNYDVILSGSMLGLNYRRIKSNSIGYKEDFEMTSMDFEEDIRKYLPGLEQTKVLSIFRCIPAQLAKQNKKFQITKVARGARLSRYMDAIEWLNDAGMVNLCYCLNFPELPLKGNGDRTRFKIYFKDTGLLIASLDEEAQEDLRANQNLGVYKGALYENMIAEALFKAGLPLFYYKKENSSLEEDFFIRSQHELIPLEVKAGNGAAASLRQLIKNPNYGDIHRGIKLVRGNIGCQENIYTFPYFCAFLLKHYVRSLDATRE